MQNKKYPPNITVRLLSMSFLTNLILVFLTAGLNEGSPTDNAGKKRLDCLVPILSVTLRKSRVSDEI